GLVVDGGIYRHEFVADTVIKALMDVPLRTEVPVFSAVLTPPQFHETEVPYDFFRRHFAIKGVEFAAACAETLLGLERLRGQVAACIVSPSAHTPLIVNPVAVPIKSAAGGGRAVETDARQDHVRRTRSL